MEALKVMNTKKDLDVPSVLSLFKKLQRTQPTLPPFQPRGGEVYIFRPTNDQCKDDWRADGYRWFQYGTKKLPRQAPVICKSYFLSVTCTGHSHEFRRCAYKLLDSKSSLVLIHYIGDESIAVAAPHGNSTNSNRVFYRTCPSVLKKIASENESPEIIYKSLISKSEIPTQYQHTLVPRDMRQIVNIQQRERQKSRLTRDALYNMHELAFDLGGFVKVIMTYPDMIVVCGHEKLLIELNNLLQIESIQPQLLSYDTTFQLGDFYLSPLLFRHTLFLRSPIVPALFLIHERKFQLVHDTMMQQAAKLIPNLVKGKRKIPVVTDDESVIIQSIAKYLPQAVHVSCWNHTINAMKVWLKKHGATAAEIPAYTGYVRDLLNQPCITDYNKTLNTYKIKWSKSFLDYYMEQIHPKVLSSLGRWILEELDIYSPFTGVTNNQSESFNATLKRLQKRKEVPVDTILLSLYHIQAFYYNEVQRGLAGLGEYQLHSLYKSVARSVDELDLIKCYPLDKIVTSICGNYNVSQSIKEEVVSHNQSDIVEDGSNCTDNDEQKRDDCNNSALTTSLSRARFIVDQGLISHNQNLGVFTVKGTTGNAHAIRLFPSESCTCPASGGCYHILAVRISVGLEDKVKLKKINLTQLRRNTRYRTDKKSGRKAPRPGDCDINPAPDSVHEKSSNENAIVHIPVEDKKMVCRDNFSALSSPGKEIVESQHLPRKRKLEYTPKKSEKKVCMENISSTSSSWKSITTKCQNLPTADMQYNNSEILSQTSSVSSNVTTEDNEMRSSCTGSVHFEALQGRRKRCGDCAYCKAKDCGLCRFCQDMVKFGGKGTLKQSCVERKCKQFRKGETLLCDHKSTKPVACINHCQVLPEDLKTLEGNNWLNDKIIDAYVFLVMDGANKETENSAYCTSSFFYAKLCASGYMEVASWIKTSLLSYKKFIVPVNTGNHWCLLVVDFVKYEIRFYDSLLGDGTHCMRRIQEYLNFVLPTIKSSRWKFLHPRNIPVQKNSWDCGVFLCMYARCQAFNVDFYFSQKDAVDIRQKMKEEITQMKLL